MLLWLGLISMLIGVALTVRGWRGRTTDDHPICRRCRYDLVGSGEAEGCPECGADLTRAHATRIGNRQRRRGLVAAGVVLVLLSLSLVGGSAYVRVTGFDWIRHKPFSWTLSGAVAGAGQANEPNVAELERRYNAGLLSPRQIAQLVAAALGVQADRTVALPNDWAPLLEQLITGQKLSQDDLALYLKQGITQEFKVKPVLRRGRTIVLYLKTDLWIRMWPGFHRESEAVTLGGVQIMPSGSFQGPDGYIMGLQLNETDFANVPNGPTRLETTIVYRIGSIKSTSYAPVVLRIPVSIPVELAGHDAIVDAFVMDESMRAAMDAAWTNARVETESDRTSVWVRIERPPVALAMGVWLVQGEAAWQVGTLQVEAGEAARWHKIESRGAQLPQPGPVTVELLPDQVAADWQLELGTYWGEAISRSGVIVDAPYVPPFNMDKTLAPMVEQTVYLDEVIVESGRRIQLRATLSSRTPPVRIEYRVRVRTGSAWVDAEDHQQLRARMGQNMSYGTGGLPLPDPDATHADIMLIPNPDWESRSTDQTPPWGYPILFERVPLSRGQVSGPIYGRALIDGDAEVVEVEPELGATDD